jgi:protein-disulfide isomerase
MTSRLLTTTLSGLMLLMLVGAEPGSTQPGAELETLRREIEALKEGQTAIQKDLQELKTLLRGRQAPPASEPREVVLRIDGASFQGDRNAKLTLVEFSDYQCPFCARHARDTLPQIQRDYIKTGKMKYVLRDLPLEAIHPQAFKAAEAAHCAGEQARYWEMHHRLFADQGALGVTDLLQHAGKLGLEVDRFRQCLESGRHATTIRESLAEAQKAGITGTPTFFLGLTAPDSSTVKAVRIIRGAQPYSRFREVIEGLLSSRQD